MNNNWMPSLDQSFNVFIVNLIGIHIGIDDEDMTLDI